MFIRDWMINSLTRFLIFFFVPFFFVLNLAINSHNPVGFQKKEKKKKIKITKQ